MDFAKYISEDQKGIWRYKKLMERNGRLSLSSDFCLNLEEKSSPLLSFGQYFLKREDKNKLGSFKSRSLAYQVSHYLSQGYKTLVISSSGNAGICAAKYCDLVGIKLICLISPETELPKKAALSQTQALIIESKKAMRLANYIAAKYKIPNLRPSIDDLSIPGFETIAYELFEQNSQSRDIFSFVTSGSSFIGIFNGFSKLKDLGFIKAVPRMNAVINLGAHSISKGVKNSRRLDAVMEVVKISKGQLYNISKSDIERLSGDCLDLSRQLAMESKAVLAAIEKSHLPDAIAVIGGKNWQLENLELKGEFKSAESLNEIDTFMKELSLST